MKKIISILIALTMLVSMIPSVFAEGEAAEVKTYVLNRTVVGDGTTNVLLSTVTTYENRGWKYFDMADSILANQSTSDNIAAVKTATNSLIFYLNSNTGNLAFALSLEAPGKAGFYIPKVEWYSGNNNQAIRWYMNNPVKDKLAVGDYTIDSNLILYTGSKGTANAYTDIATTAIYSVPGDEIISSITSEAAKQYKFKNIYLTEILNPVMTITIDEANAVSFDIADGDVTNDTATASARVSGDNQETAMPVSNNFITYKSSNEAVATVTSDGTVTAIGAGEAKIWAESKDNVYKSNEITVTVAGAAEPSEDEDLSNAFDAKEEKADTYVESTVTGITQDETIEAEKNSDGTFTLTAPETKNGEKFLYWAKGMSKDKKIVSFSNKLEAYMPEEDGKNYLIAVYEGDVSDTAEYYNANGQRIATKTEPELPSMAGYGNATGWQKYGETNIYVAEYENKTQPDNVTVTVDGKSETVPYGTEIVCTADSTKENFKCWTKSDINGKTEIVSADKTYKFKAWENCTVEAVYEEHTYTGKKLKIIIDTFTAGNATAVMAEFIGFGSNVVEKGIMFEGKRIAMTKPGNQFTVIADESGTYEGYAIVGNQTDGYKLITDGEYKK